MQLVAIGSQMILNDRRRNFNQRLSTYGRARAMAAIYEQNRSVCKYVHSVSSGHEAIQLATAFQLEPQDYVSPYYRDESMLLGLGFFSRNTHAAVAGQGQ